MKHNVLLFLIFLSSLDQAASQTKSVDPGEALDVYVGSYYPKLDPTSRFIIRKEKDKNLVLEIVGQGRIPLTRIGKDKFKPENVKPKATIEFVRGSTGEPTYFKWIQPIPGYTFQRIASEVDSLASLSNDPFSKYIGDFRMEGNRYNIIWVRLEDHQLTTIGPNQGKIFIMHESGDRFVVTDSDLRVVYDFIPNAAGKIESMQFSRKGSVSVLRTDEKIDDNHEVIYGFNRLNGFTRADTLRGRLSPLRDCFDVLFYSLRVKIDPERKMVSGQNEIRFKVVHPFNQLQIDLFANMKIEQILFHDMPLSYTREFNAVFIQFPEVMKEGATDEITIIYSGKPQKPDSSSMAGGIFWLQDKEGQYWIETVTQGSGASLWWPCKDHLSDKPDSMKISVTVPTGLTDISNGRLLRKEELPGNLTRFDWYVSYPITNYCVAMNIGNYVQMKDLYISGEDSLSLNFYSMKYDTSIAKMIFKHTKPMLSVFERSFEKYPFWRDGFTVMESIYPMEHQGAVSIGSIFNPFNSSKYDSLDLVRTMWHEVAHEWWGNSVTVKDFADLWIHEAFATYAEVLAFEALHGSRAMAKYLSEQMPSNKEPIIGTYGVNDFRLGDIYSKGALILHTLRNLIADDSLWFDLLRSIQTNFAYQTITTKDLVNYINDQTKTDYGYFFEQYLTKPSIPELQMLATRRGKSVELKYRWNAAVQNFNMPIRITMVKNVYTFIYPTTEWKTLVLPDIKPKEIKVDKVNFYIQSQIQFGDRWQNK